MNRYSPLPASLLLLVACTTEPPTCADVDAPPPMGACVGPEGGWENDEPNTLRPLEVLFPGTVTEVLTSAPADGCFAGGAHVGESGADTVWLRATDGADDAWVIGVSIAGIAASTLPAVGEPILVDYTYTAGEAGPDVGSLLIRRGDDSIAVWIGQAADLETLEAPPELSIAQDTEVCSEFDDCRAWSKYHVAVAIDGQPADDGLMVPHGRTEDLEGFRVHHGGYEQQTSTSGECTDDYLGVIRMGLVSQA